MTDALNADDALDSKEKIYQKKFSDPPDLVSGKYSAFELRSAEEIIKNIIRNFNAERTPGYLPLASNCRQIFQQIISDSRVARSESSDIAVQRNQEIPAYPRLFSRDNVSVIEYPKPLLSTEERIWLDKRLSLNFNPDNGEKNIKLTCDIAKTGDVFLHKVGLNEEARKKYNFPAQKCNCFHLRDLEQKLFSEVKKNYLEHN
ncbi:MAG: hypothetical protein LBP22_00480 [Deltaproteobacteria bacterium]|nr:hypothetical protein [Deltaproteobacteria bacterium]